MSPLKNIIDNGYKADLLQFLHSTPDCFDELLALALSDDRDYAFRAAWAVGLIMKYNDSRLRNNIGEIMQILPHRADNHKRVLLMILKQMEIPEALEGQLFDFCVTLWETTAKPPSLRINAFYIIAKIAKKYPELQNEFRIFTENRYLETLSHGIRHSAEIIIQENFNVKDNLQPLK